MKTEVNLSELPYRHELRNLPLSDIGAECRNLNQTNWRPVKSWSIGREAYNNLSGTWLDNNEFRVWV
jgi:hypothetical protein